MFPCGQLNRFWSDAEHILKTGGIRPVQLKGWVAGSVVASLMIGAVPASVEAQSLRGSLASIARMYRQAVREKLHFYETASGVRTAARKGKLVRLRTNENTTYAKVRWPYVQPETRLFVDRLGAQYRTACGKRLVVTSAVRPATRQPSNASGRSVHPTGMAVDLRKPRGKCLTWLRATLLELEKEGIIEATEERKPPHFHVAVFPSRYERYLAGKSARSSASEGR